MGGVRGMTPDETSVFITSLVSAAALTWLSAALVYWKQWGLWLFINLLPKVAASSVLRVGPAVREGGKQAGRSAPVPKDKICKGHWALTSHFYLFTALSWIISQAVKSPAADKRNINWDHGWISLPSYTFLLLLLQCLWHPYTVSRSENSLHNRSEPLWITSKAEERESWCQGGDWDVQLGRDQVELWCRTAGSDQQEHLVHWLLFRQLFLGSGPSFALKILCTTWIISARDFLVSKADHCHRRTSAFVTEI